MKKITCYDCDKEFQSETPDEVLQRMYDHYMEVHKEIITGVNEDEKKAWMKHFHADWEKAEVN